MIKRKEMKVSKIALALFMLVAIEVTAFSASPEICRVNGGNTKTIWGTGFTAGQTEVYVWNVPFNENEALAALEVKVYKGKSLLTAQPPKEAKKLNILSTDPRGLVMAVEFSDNYSAEGFYGDRIGGQVVWVKNADGYSKPWLVHSATPWWVYPSKTSAGDRVRVFGRNISAKLAVIRKAGDTKIQKLPFGGMVHNAMYETEVTLPKDLQPGEYELFLHNGSGGTAGWSNPMKLTIKPADKSVKKYYSATAFGAKGDSHTDDSKAIKRAIAEAGKTRGIVLLGPGCFIISETLELPFGVSILGSGSGATTIQVTKANPMRNGFPDSAILENNGWLPHLKDNGCAPMLWARNNNTVSDLTLQYDRGAAFGILVARCPGVAEDIHIERIKVYASEQADNWIPSLPLSWIPLVPIFLAGNTYGLVISDNEFHAWSSIDAQGGGQKEKGEKHFQAYIGRNRFITFPTGIGNSIFLRGVSETIIESNHATFGIRNFSTQVAGRHVVLIGNVFESNLARRHNDGELMYESGNSLWRGYAAASDGNSVTVSGKPFNKDMADSYIVILDGKGIGQYRRVISNTVNKLTFETAWDIQPDETTYMVLGRFNADHLWIDNTEEHNASWTGFWGNNVGIVVDGHIMRDGGGLTLWAWDNKNPSTVAFVDFIGCRTIERGGIAFIGSPVFGNTIRFCEIIDFRYKPNYHIQPTWMKGNDPNNYAAISISRLQKFEGMPDTTPLNGWNVIEGNHIYDGPVGIRINPSAQYTILKRNAIFVDKDTIIKESGRVFK